MKKKITQVLKSPELSLSLVLAISLSLALCLLPVGWQNPARKIAAAADEKIQERNADAGELSQTAWRHTCAAAAIGSRRSQAGVACARTRQLVSRAARRAHSEWRTSTAQNIDLSNGRQDRASVAFRLCRCAHNTHGTKTVNITLPVNQTNPNKIQI